MAPNPRSLVLPEPTLQVDFSVGLAAARKAYLMDALSATVGEMDVPTLDRQIAEFVPREFIAGLASGGLRAELLFPVPLLLEQNPRLLAYYRLLLGFSRKEFYANNTGAAGLRVMEDAGKLPNNADLPGLSRAMIQCATVLVDGIGVKRITRQLVDDLTLLTLGPQLRGGANVKKGSTAIRAVFELIHSIVKDSVSKAFEKRLEVTNAAGRKVVIQFSADPDIVIREAIGKKDYRNIAAIEIKGGTDYSNIHNRLGEAEKSHQNARKKGYVECWTIVNVAKIDYDKAAQESPSTNRFYLLSSIIESGTEQFEDFRSRIVGLTGIKN